MEDTGPWTPDRRADFYESVWGKRPIVRKHPGPCPKVACLECYNYDPEKKAGYSCLVKGISRTDPTEKRICCWFVGMGQVRLV